MKFYRAFYTIKNNNAVGGKVALRFIGKNMKQEYKTLEELKQAIKEADIKNVISYEIQEIEAKTIEIKDIMKFGI